MLHHILKENAAKQISLWRKHVRDLQANITLSVENANIFIAFSTFRLFLYAPFKSLPILADTEIACNLFLLYYANCEVVIVF